MICHFKRCKSSEGSQFIIPQVCLGVVSIMSNDMSHGNVMGLIDLLCIAHFCLASFSTSGSSEARKTLFIFSSPLVHRFTLYQSST